MPDKKIYNHALDLDKETEAQFQACSSQPFVTAAALMPDAHRGYAAPIGAVLITQGKIVPAWVGYDIGCGLIAVKISNVNPKDNLVKLVRDKAKDIHIQVNNSVPMGLGRTNDSNNSLSPDTNSQFSKILHEFEAGPHDKSILQYIKQTAHKHLGTLGSGNHFIELSSFKENELWLVIHSGSRGIGHKVAQKYMIKASGSQKNYEKTFPLDSDSQLGKEYLNILDFGLKYALLNRLEMASRIVSALEKTLKLKLKSSLWTNKTHNHAIPGRGSLYIHRKGATPAKKGERGVIPANMRDGSFLVEGKGNPKFLHSSSHGAGRALSRTQAKQQITMQQFKKQMEGITSSVSQKTLDEAPDAYKDIDSVMSAQKSSVKPLKHLLPIINWKG
jgi:tRNA-splicing ligase RtcB (3'-phosphate/5'-hydroxy nucleic acid ligase)